MVRITDGDAEEPALGEMVADAIEDQIMGDATDLRQVLPTELLLRNGVDGDVIGGLIMYPADGREEPWLYRGGTPVYVTRPEFDKAGGVLFDADENIVILDAEEVDVREVTDGG